MKHFVVLFLVLSVVSLGHGDLKSASILFRHGERTPVFALPKYGETTYSKELGFQQLTLTGSQQAYNNGVTLRSRYLGLLPESGYFRSSNMKILSSSASRCIGTLTSFLAGFFPPPTKDKTIPFPWQSIPFAVDNEAQVLTIKPEVCAKYLVQYKAAVQEITANAEANWVPADKAMSDKLETLMGTPMNSYGKLEAAAEIIRTNQYLDPSTPGWAVNYLEGALFKYFKGYMDAFNHNEYMVRVRGGPLMTQIINNMVAVQNKNSTAKNLQIFSAHDSNLLVMAIMLGVEDQITEDNFYVDTFSVELHQTGTSEPEVQVWYFSNASKKPYKKQIFLPSCKSPCSLSQFNAAMSKWIVRDLDALCQL